MLVSPVLNGRRWLGSRFDRYFGGSITPDILSVGGLLSPSASQGSFGEEINILLLKGIEALCLSKSASDLVTTVSELSWLVCS